MEQVVQIAQYTLIATGIFVALGGVMGFVKAKSTISLIMGILSGLLLVGCYFLSMSEAKYGLVAGVVLLSALDGMFSVRFAKTKKFMPSGMMVAVCSLAEIIVVVGTLKAFGML